MLRRVVVIYYPSSKTSQPFWYAISPSEHYKVHSFIHSFILSFFLSPHLLSAYDVPSTVTVFALKAIIPMTKVFFSWVLKTPSELLACMSVMERKAAQLFSIFHFSGHGCQLPHPLPSSPSPPNSRRRCPHTSSPMGQLVVALFPSES